MIGPAIRCGKNVTNSKYDRKFCDSAISCFRSIRYAICVNVKNEIPSGNSALPYDLPSQPSDVAKDNSGNRYLNQNSSTRLPAIAVTSQVDFARSLLARTITRDIAKLKRMEP